MVMETGGAFIEALRGLSNAAATLGVDAAVLFAGFKVYRLATPADEYGAVVDRDNRAVAIVMAFTVLGIAIPLGAANMLAASLVALAAMALLSVAAQLVLLLIQVSFMQRARAAIFDEGEPSIAAAFYLSSWPLAVGGLLASLFLRGAGQPLLF